MILSGKEIHKQVAMGKISIEPFDERLINPNSYNLRLHNELLIYTDQILDMKKQLNTERIVIPEDGFILQPGRLYLGRTYERTSTSSFVPMLEGRSSIGRLGLFIHVTAGFGDIGFSGYWTLEIQCVQPVKIYPMVEICQIYYHTIDGDFESYNGGKYQNNTGIQPSMLYKDFEKCCKPKI
ncbi:MAG: dCTP deaminase [Clostridiaceae bacterium]|nr:dCTP deaminase [Clostridiaceae bacterium]